MNKATGLLISTTIGPVDAGIIDVLIEAYTDANPEISVRYISRGTGAAIKLAREGNIDLVIAHAKILEEQFVADGFGTERIPFMYNDFVLVGPENDPVGAVSSENICEAMKKISNSRHRFISRGDMSGTNVKELDIWEAADVALESSWYEKYEKGNTGSKATLLHADTVNAYSLIDRGTFIACKDELQNTKILYENDEIMLNYINIIPCDPKKVKGIDADAAADFINWLIGHEAQTIIKDFGVEKYGEPLFFPNAFIKK